MPSERAQKMAALFDIDLESSFDDSSDYDVKAKDGEKAEPFPERVKEMQAMMEPEKMSEDIPIEIEKEEGAGSEPESGSVDPNTLLVDAVKEVASSVKELKIPDKVAKKERVEPEEIEDVPVSTSPAEKEPEFKLEPEPEDIDNPLGLGGHDLEFFHSLKKSHPEFVLYNGNPAYKDFYRFKVQILRAILSQFPVLDFRSRRKELSEVNCNHHVGKTVSAESIRAKLDECYRSRIRVVQLLAETYEQYFVWEKQLEFLEGKLWSDHESRGSHKREALAGTHLHGEAFYVKAMHGFMQSAKIIDGFLVAGAESLSRQLTCVQVKEPSSADHVYRFEQSQQKKVEPAKDTSMDHLDGLNDGSVISAPERSTGPRMVESLGQFDPDDELMTLV